MRANEDDIVVKFTTGEGSKATILELYLGTYAMYEAKAKGGFALYAKANAVVLNYAGRPSRSTTMKKR